MSDTRDNPFQLVYKDDHKSLTEHSSSTNVLSAPQSIDIINQLFEIQGSLNVAETDSVLQIDTTFLLTRKALKTVSSCLSTNDQDASDSGQSRLAEERLQTTMALGCMGVMWLIANCYILLQSRISRSKSDGRRRRIQIGDFQLEGDDDLHGEVLTFVLTKEIRQYREILGQLEVWARQLVEKNHSENALLLPFLKGAQLKLKSSGL